METFIGKMYASHEQNMMLRRCGYSLRLWTVQELLELLPESVTVDGTMYFFVLRKYYDIENDDVKFEAAYEDIDERTLNGCICNSRDPLDALLSLLVSLHDNNIISHEKA